MRETDGHETRDDELDGLIRTALRAAPEEEEILSSSSIELTDADRRALDAPGPDLVNAAMAAGRPVEPRRRPRGLSWRICAAVLCAIGLGIGFLATQRSAPTLTGCTLDAEPRAAYDTVAPRRVSLEDGTLHVTVAPGEEPFVVETGAGDVVVRGAAFSITASAPPGSAAAARFFTSVLVTEGQVVLANDFGRAAAGAGELLLSESDAPPVVRRVGEARGPWDGGLAIVALAVTGDGGLIVTADEAATLRVWDARDGKLVRVVASRHDERITALAMSPDGRTLASASQDGTVRLWDIRRGAPLRSLEGHGYSVNAVAFAGGGARLVSASTDGTVRTWDVASGELATTMGTPGRKGDEGYRRTIVGIAVSPSGTSAYSVDLGGRLSIWDLGKGTRIRAIETGQSALYSVAALPDGAALVGAEDGTLSRIDVGTGRRIWSSAGAGGPVATIAVAPDRRRALVTRAGPAVELIELDTGRAVSDHAGSRSRTAAVAWFPDGGRWVAGGAEGILRIRDTETESWINRDADESVGHPLPVSALAFSADGRRAASGGEDGSIRIWSMPDAKPVGAIQATGGAVRALVFHPARDSIFSISDDGVLRETNIGTGKVRAGYQGDRTALRALAFSPDRSLAATGDESGAIRLWPLGPVLGTRKLEGHEVEIAAVRFSPDGKLLVSGDRDGNLRWWDVETGETVRTLYVTEVSMIEFSADARQALAPSLAFDHPDPGLHLWDLETKRCRTLRAKDERRFASGPAVFALNGSRVVEAVGEELRVWDAESGKLLRTIAEEATGAPRGRVTALAVSRDGRVAITASGDRSLRVFAIPED